MPEPWNVLCKPIVGLISHPARWYVSIVWALRRLDDSIDKSDTITAGSNDDYKLGHDDAALIRDAVASGKVWPFAGGSFHFTISNIPIATVLSLALSGVGTVVLQAPERMRFDSVVSPIGMSKSSIFTLGSVLDKLSDIHTRLADSGANPFQLLELIPCGSAVDCEYMLTGAELMGLVRDVLCRSELSRYDLLIDNVVAQMLGVARKSFPVVFSGVGDCSKCSRDCKKEAT